MYKVPCVPFNDCFRFLWVFFKVFRRNEIPKKNKTTKTNNHFMDDLGYWLTLFPFYIMFLLLLLFVFYLISFCFFLL